MAPSNYDAMLLVSFGGPDGTGDVLPFLENVVRGRRVPRERMQEVAEHYYQVGGASPINSQNSALIAALVDLLNAQGPHLPVYWGNRNWHPLLPDAIGQMAEDGIKQALAFVTSPYSSYSSCRQYLENIEQARAQAGANAPRIDKLRNYYNHPGFVEATVDRVREAIAELPANRRAKARVLFTAHSIPVAMSASCQYEAQLQEVSQLVAAGAGCKDWHLVYQSRSGPPSQPWLEPDVCVALEQIGSERSAQDVVLVPIGFIADHMEVIYDLDVEAQDVCQRAGLNMFRAQTVGTHPRFVQMIRELILERVSGDAPRLAFGNHAPCPDVCPDDCCVWRSERT